MKCFFNTYCSNSVGPLNVVVGNPQGIQVHAVFISNSAGETLKLFAQSEKGECCISPLSEGRAWTVLVISIFSLIIILSVFGMLLLARKHRMRRQQVPQHSPHVNCRMVKSLPTVTFTTACQNENRTAATCSICLEDYQDGESLRVLPCRHGKILIDLSLTICTIKCSF